MRAHTESGKALTMEDTEVCPYKYKDNDHHTKKRPQRNGPSGCAMNQSE